MAALSIRAALAKDSRSAADRAYRSRVLADEAAWRRRRAVPTDRDSHQAALATLNATLPDTEH
jgi:hypothetical protein